MVSVVFVWYHMALALFQPALGVLLVWHWVVSVVFCGVGDGSDVLEESCLWATEMQVQIQVTQELSMPQFPLSASQYACFFVSTGSERIQGHSVPGSRLITEELTGFLTPSQ